MLIGYSFGASLVPVVANRLPDAARERLDGGVLISPDDDAVFEIHVGDWFGSTHHAEALPIGPEMQASKVPLVCVHGTDESDSFCMKPQPAHVQGGDVAGRASLQRGLSGAGGVDRQEVCRCAAKTGSRPVNLRDVVETFDVPNTTPIYRPPNRKRR